MKNNLLVTLADKNYIDQVKQLFSSVYWNAGWKGDYMLLAHEIPEEDLAWFRDKGILIRHCKSIHNVNFPDTFPITHIDKFYLFTPEFKKWDTIVYLDADIIVRYSLEELTHIKGFCAVRDSVGYRLLKKQFHFINSEDVLSKKFKKEFKKNAPAFNAGVIAFSTDVIAEDSFETLCELLVKYYKNLAMGLGDQPIFNLYFHKRWKKLSRFYNIFIPSLVRFPLLGQERIDGAILHFTGIGRPKPWSLHSPFYSEWKTNLEKANSIDLNNPRTSRPVFKKAQEIKYSFLTIPFYMYRSFNRQAGLFGLFLKRRYPNIYFRLKNLKG